ncbi:transcriptional regulator with XRE-family HTH domain [Saccharothrix coeruleofusca]|uniref:DUF5753 domain-containing protein n=1 Tax=Saccharothrix coeruleofusca TaxID=33919 RepID=UPI001AE85767|nr:DUF5753 domain-containing protein [Saccharothrix coeruleofusca]MBP2339940.1 transcriptional regulator with XRE-family HTH domain [Saccharothrix coeruleofusca]
MGQRDPGETTVRSRELGEELRRVRRRANLRAERLSAALGWSAGKLSRLEHGKRGTNDLDLGSLLGALGVDATTRERIRRLSQERDLGHYVRPHDGIGPDSLLSLTMHERIAATMCKYEPALIPGLLQTEAYARAVLGCGDLPPEELDQQVALRLNRQQVLTGPDAPDAVFYLHENALRNAIGGRRIMHDQMMRLLFMCDWRKLTLRVIPQGTGHPALTHGFNLMTFAERLKPVAYTESDVATLFSEDGPSIKLFQHKRDVLARLALDAEQSRSVFAHWADVYDGGEDRDDRGSALA